MSSDSVKLKYSFDETKNWAKTEAKDSEDGISVLYIFGAIALLFFAAAILMYYVSDTPPESNVKIDENVEGEETDGSTSEIHSEYDLLEDAPKHKNSLEPAKK
jgi:hypothetical protein